MAQTRKKSFNMRLYLKFKSTMRHPLNRDKRREFRRKQRNSAYKTSILAALARTAQQETILFVTHNWGGGIERHVGSLVRLLNGLVNVVILRIVDNGLELQIPTMPEEVGLKLRNNEYRELTNFLQIIGIGRVHIHHMLGQETVLRHIINELKVPFDVTIHDYYIVCPQIHLRTPTVARYCGELGVQQCNRCIAEYNPFGARDIEEWRTSHTWFAETADRVICPSRDVRDRIAKYYPQAKLIVVPHEAILTDSWIVNVPQISANQSLRVTIIGYLTAHKGRDIVEACVRQGAQSPIEFFLIGITQPSFAPEIRQNVVETGIYHESELVHRLRDLRPHVIWFPQPVPESYSYTLTSAIDSGLPIVASRIGALPERLEGRPFTWFVDDVAAPASEWLSTFEFVREQLLTAPLSPQLGKRTKSEPYYPVQYLISGWGKRENR
jgi:glycosyltransferase involved in cell wall biosynthesis